jgi:hypothetical protein
MTLRPSRHAHPAACSHCTHSRLLIERACMACDVLKIAAALRCRWEAPQELLEVAMRPLAPHAAAVTLAGHHSGTMSRRGCCAGA